MGLMGERKVLNRYYPPDFDPAKLPKGERAFSNSMKVRMMMAMNVQCLTCGTFIYKGTKFNMRKEDVHDEDYLGLQLYRFYFRCPHCSSEISLKTDPMNCDYLVEYGAHRTAEDLNTNQIEMKDKYNVDQKATDIISNLENDNKETIKQTEYHDDIESIRAIRDKQNNLRIDTILNAIQRKSKSEDEKELNYLLDKQIRIRMKNHVANKKYSQTNLSLNTIKSTEININIKK